MPDFIKKCGVICTTILPMKPEYQLICIICNTQFTQLDNFILHFDTEHRSSLDETILNDSQGNSEDEFSTENLGCMQHNIEIINLKSRSLMCGKYQAKNSSTICMESEDVDTGIKEDILESECVERDCSSDDWENEFMNENKSVESLNEFQSETEIDATLHEEIYEIMEGGVNVADIVHNNIESDNPDVVNPDESAKRMDLLSKYGKNMIQAVLSACGKHPILWDKTARHANNTWFREKAYKRIAKTTCSIGEWKAVRDIIQRLRIRIHDQMRKKQLGDINGDVYIPLWESDIDAFLDTPRKRKKKAEVNMTEDVLLPSATMKKASDDESGSCESHNEVKNVFADNKALDCCESTGTESDSDHHISPITMYDEKTLKAIFTSYTHHDILWNVEDPMHKNDKLREKAFMSIASEIGRPSEWRHIRDILQRFRIRLRKELDKKKIAKGNNSPFIWEQDLNLFLKPRKPQTYIPKSKKFILPNSKLSDSQCLEFIEIYKGFSCLWDEKDITYRFLNRREEAIAGMQELLKSNTGINLTRTEIEREIVRIRKICSREKKRKLKCEQSNSIYEPQSKFFDKITFLEVDVGPFKCPFCDEVLDSITQYKIHKSSHDGSMPFSCIVCNQGFTQVGNMTVHLRRHTKDYIYECDVCHKGFAASTDLITHKRSHTGEKPYFCDICGDSFKAWSRFKNHLRRRHSEGVRNYKCETCSKAFSSRYSLLAHMETHSTVRDQICNVCGKAFKTKKYLRQHKQIHADTKKYICKICEKPFAQYAGLSGHMKTHGTTLINK